MQCRQSTTGRSTTLVIQLAAAGPQDEWPRIQGEQPAVVTHTIHPALAVWQQGVPGKTSAGDKRQPQTRRPAS